MAENLWNRAGIIFENSGVIEMNLLEHAKNEFVLAGYDLNQQEEDPDKWIVENVLQLLEVFSKQGHSGFSANYCINMFNDLAKYKPLTPLTGEYDEWIKHSNKSSLWGKFVEWWNDTYLYQNIRASHVFKRGKNGKPYDINGKIFKDSNGCTWTSKESKVYIDFPYIPKTIIVETNEKD